MSRLMDEGDLVRTNDGRYGRVWLWWVSEEPEDEGMTLLWIEINEEMVEYYDHELELVENGLEIMKAKIKNLKK